MATLGEVLVKFGADISDFNKKMGEVKNTMENVGNKLKSVGQTMTLGITTPLVGVGTSIVMVGARFDEAMSKVNAVTGATAGEMDNLRNTAKRLASETKYGSKEVADAMGFLGMAGFKTNEILSSLPNVLLLASAGTLDLARAADIASNIMSGFGMSADEMGRISDVLAKTAASANTNVEQMGNAMSYVAPFAKGLGLSMEESAAAIGIMSNNAIQGERAGTALRGILAQLSDVSGSTKDALKNLGLSANDVNPSMHSLSDILATLKSKGIDAATAIQLVGVESGPALLALLAEGSEGLSNFTNELVNSAGAAYEMDKIMNDNVSGGFKQLLSAIEGLAISLYEQMRPAIETVTLLLTELTRSFDGLSPTAKNIAIGIAAVAAAAGPVIFSLGLLSVAIGAISAPVAIVVGAIAGLSAAFVYLWNTNEDFRDAVIGIWEKIKSAGTAIWNQFGDSIVKIITTAWNTITGVTENVLGIISGLLDVFIGLFTGNWSQLADGLTTIWRNLWDGINKILKGSWEILKATFAGLYSGISTWFKDLAKDALGWGKNLMSNFIEGFKSMFGNLRDIVSRAAETISDFLGFHSPAKRGPASDADKWIPNLVDMFANDMREGIPKLESRLSDMAIALSPNYAMAGGGSFETSPTAPSGNTFDITIQGGDSDELMDKLERKLKQWGLI